MSDYPQLQRFQDEVRKRLDVGAREYGNRSFSKTPLRLIREIQEELVDVSGWAYLLWLRLERMKDAAMRLETMIKVEEDT